MQDEIYGGTHSFVTVQFKKFGIDYSFIKTEANEIEKSIRNNTKLIYIESPTNPLLSIIEDIDQAL